MAKQRPSSSSRSKAPRVRIERDSMGEMKVPDWALWGASTQRAKENFPISHRGVPAEVVRGQFHLRLVRRGPEFVCVQKAFCEGKTYPATCPYYH